MKFEPNRSLLNNIFEKYKLKPTHSTSEDEEEGELVSVMKLLNPTMAITPLDESFNLQVMSYRQSLNVLYSHQTRANISYYFSPDHSLWQLELGEEEICSQVLDSTTLHKKYPSMVAFGNDCILALRDDYSKLEIVSEDGAYRSHQHLPFIQNFPFCHIEGAHRRGDGHFVVITCIDNIEATSSKATFFLVVLCVQDDRVDFRAAMNSPTRPTSIICDTEGLIIGSGLPFLMTSDKETFLARPRGFEWGQEKDFIHLTIQLLPEMALPQVSFTEQSFTIQPCHIEELKECSLYAKILPQECSYDISEGLVLKISLKKAHSQTWISLKPLDCHRQRDKGLGNGTDPARQLAHCSFVKYSWDNFEETLWKSEEICYTGVYQSYQANRYGVVVKYGNDALAYTFGPGDYALHVRTYDALSYVMSGKSDSRYCLFNDLFGVLVENRQHVYLYQCRQNQQLPEKSLNQYLIKLPNKELIVGWHFARDDLLVLITGQTVLIIPLPQP